MLPASSALHESSRILPRPCILPRPRRLHKYTTKSKSHLRTPVQFENLEMSLLLPTGRHWRSLTSKDEDTGEIHCEKGVVDLNAARRKHVMHTTLHERSSTTRSNPHAIFLLPSFFSLSNQQEAPSHPPLSPSLTKLFSRIPSFCLQTLFRLSQSASWGSNDHAPKGTKWWRILRVSRDPLFHNGGPSHRLASLPTSPRFIGI